MKRFALLLGLILVSTARARAELASSVYLDLDDCDDIAADSRNFYLACHSTHPPGVSPATPPNMDAYVAKLDRRTSHIVYLVRLGGQGLDVADRILIDRRGFAYVTGFTGSRDFPVSHGALQSSYAGGDSDAFLTVIKPNGRIVYSTYFGGSQADQGNGIAFGGHGDVLIAGTTWSLNLPFIAASYGPRGKGDAFIARINPFKNTIHSSIVMGGSGVEKLTGIAYSRNRVFLTGYTESADFPAKGALQSSLKGASDAFLAALDTTSQSVVFSTFLGGSAADSSWGVAVDRQGNPVIAGISESDDLTTTVHAPQRMRAGKSDAFFAKLSSAGQQLLFSTYYGGTGLDHSGYDGQNIAVAKRGAIYAVGLTNSRDLVVPGAFHRSYGGGEQDGFLVAFAPDGKLCYGSYIGGTARYLLEGVTLADNERMVVAVGTVIRPAESNSPKPDEKEKYGAFAISLKAPTACSDAAAR